MKMIGALDSTNPPNVVLDYSILDHLYRIRVDNYKGGNARQLKKLYATAIARKVSIWLTEITRIEMIHGIENLEDDENKSAAQRRDNGKLAIADEMHSRTLGYPCSRFDDTYSRWDVSFRFAGPNWENADALLRTLESIEGVSTGDAHQLVCCAYPFDGDQIDSIPDLSWFISEDRKLVRAIHQQIGLGKLPELKGIQFVTSAEISEFLDQRNS